MPRVTYENRLQDLINNPMISTRDKDFAGSLLSYYKRRRTLTSGRVRCVKQLEERYSPEACKALQDLRNNAEESSVVRDVKELIGRCERASWDLGFAESILEQLLAGRMISDKQMSVLEKVKDRNSPKSVADRDFWISGWEGSENQKKFEVMMGYYAHNKPYFSTIVAGHEISKSLGETYVPSVRVFKKVTDGNFAKKVLEEAFRAPKFPAGSAVRIRRSERMPMKIKGKAAAVINTDAPIISAAKGSKRYQVVIIGESTPIFVEERDLLTKKLS